MGWPNSAPFRVSSSARVCKVCRVYTTPEGLLGELISTAWVRGVSMASTASSRIWNSGTSGGTTLNSSPAAWAKGLYSGK